MKNEAQIGDKVEVHTGKKIYEGILLEAPADEKGIILVKLNSGYNLGLIKKDILEIKSIESRGDGFRKQEPKLSKIKLDSKKPNVAMIITGGTIASRLDAKTGGVSPLDSPEELFKFYPAMFKHVNVSRVEIPFMKFSEDMDYLDWKKLAKITGDLLNDSNIQGVIITHGTDSLHYTSAALSFFLRNLNKPVVLTYSQRSIDRASSDANLNLECSALAAISDIAEVMLVGHAESSDSFCYAMNGAKVRKLHSSKRDAFKPVNTKPFAKISDGRIDILSEHNLRNKNKVLVDSKFENKVALIKFYPGQDPDILDYYVEKGYKGIVLEVLGLGQIATKNSRKSWLQKLKDVQEAGIFVCAASQTINGALNPKVYSSGRELEKIGIVYLKDMLSETAFVKLGWVLGHEKWDVKEKMLENISREYNGRLN
ncbi:Glu-tRNA(Gln) amidotransferase subunit GatD [archaeon]|jgi:glutamyl-tRNA(Gln) amidotransferase subunit D|nr:Glu-tRNA(Gln) amidotransferase subunit GatD [archaeon]